MMAKSQSHKRAQAKAAGKTGRTEAPLSGNRRLDAKSKKTATEVERSGSPTLLRKAANRLKDSGLSQKVLVVPQPDMAEAAKAMNDVNVKGTVKNMGGTKRRSV